MTALALYVPGRSPLHRAPASIKLTALVALGAVALALSDPLSAGIALALVALGYLVAGLGARVALRQLRPAWLFLAGIAAFQWWTVGLERAASVAFAISALILAAGLVTLTTRTSEILDALVAVVRPLHRLGVDPDRVALQLALGIRSVPLIAELAQTARQAQHARGLGLSARAFAVPLVVRALRRADATSEALRARGFDD